MISIIEHKAAGVSWRGDPHNFKTRDGKEIAVLDAVPLREALERTYDTDAHFACYHVLGEAHTPRLGINTYHALLEQGARLMFDVVAIDFDAPDDQRIDGEASEDWRTDWRDKLWDLELEGGGLSWYDTRGGGRAVWELAKPVEGADRFETFLRKMLHYLRKQGLRPDMACSDWTRLFRLPYVNREGHGPQEYELELAPDGEAMTFQPPKLSLFAGIQSAGGRGESMPAVFDSGGRNNLLTRYAGMVVKQGHEDWADMVRVANDERCEPPLPAREVETIILSASSWDFTARAVAPTARAVAPTAGSVAASATSAAPSATSELAVVAPTGVARLDTLTFVLPPDEVAWDPGDEVTLNDGSESEVADRVDRHFGGDYDVIGDLGQLWRYQESTGLWRPISEGNIARYVNAMNGWRIANGQDRDGLPKFKPFLVGSRTLAGVQSLLNRTRDQPGWLSDGPTGAAFTNGFATWDGKAFTMRPKGEDNRATMGFPFAFERGLVPTKFLEALDVCFDDGSDAAGRIQLIREFVGVALLGKSTQLQQMLLFHGDGNNGKSVILDVITGLFPRNTVTSVAPTQLDHEYNRARLAQSRINIVGELPDAAIVTSDKFKQAISGDKMSGRNVTERPFDFWPIAAWVLSLNELPHVHDLSSGFWRRVLLIDFGRAIPVALRVRDLAKVLLREEAREIACWALEGGAVALARGSYYTPQASVEAVDQWRADADQIQTFLRERTTEGGWTKSATVFDHYKVFAQKNKFGTMSSTKFGRRLKKLGVEKKRTEKGWHYPFTLAR